MEKTAITRKYDCNMTDMALNYVRAGFSVIPIKGSYYARGTDHDERVRDAKAPLLNWTEYQKRLPTGEELRGWFRRWPKANIAIVTGRVSGIVVVDLDSEEAATWAEREGLLNTACVQTARGVHAYFRYPEGRRIGNSVRVSGMDIDIRADGGYVIAPPSLHITGSCYRWTRGLNELAAFPETFMRTADANERKVIDLRPLYRGVGKGSRNNALARLCGSWINDGLGFEECLEMAFAWNLNNSPPMSGQEIERTIKSVLYRHSFRDTTKQRFYHEKNFLRFPIFTRSKKKTHRNEETHVVTEQPKSRREWSVIPSARWGLPGPFDEMVFMAVNKVVSEQPRPLKNPVDIGSLRSIAEMIGYGISGHSIKLIRESILRLRSLSIISEMTYFDADRRRFLTDAFGIFDRVIFAGEVLDDGQRVRSTMVWLNSVYLKNINSGYLSPISFETYISLRSYTARGIYRVLTPIMNATNRLPVRITYKKLAEKLQIEEEEQLYRIRQQLKNAHSELIRKGIFRKIHFFDKGNRDGEAGEKRSGCIIVYEP